MSVTTISQLRPRDAVLVLPSVALAVGLLALHVANVTGAPVSSVMTPKGLMHALPAAFSTSTETGR